MNPQIQSCQQEVWTLFRAQHAALQGKSTQALSDLIHECESLRFNPDYSTAAEIVRSACLVTIDQRAGLCLSQAT